MSNNSGNKTKKYLVAPIIVSKLIGSVALPATDYLPKKDIKKALGIADKSLNKKWLLFGLIDPDSGEVVEIFSHGTLDRIESLDRDITKLRSQLIAKNLDESTDEYIWDEDSLPEGPEGPTPSF